MTAERGKAPLQRRACAACGGARVLAVTAMLVSSCTLRAQRELLERLPPDADVAAHAHAGFGPEWQPFELPGDGVVLGLARIGGRCWLLRGASLHALDWPSLREQRVVAAPGGLVGITADDRFLYGIAGRELHVLDAFAGTSMRTVEIGAAWPPSALAVHRGSIHVAIDQSVATLDPADGSVRRVRTLPAQPHWIASDGVRLWWGGAAGCAVLAGDAASGTSVSAGWLWPETVPESTAVWLDGRLLLVFEERGSPPLVTRAGLLTTAACLPAEHVVLEMWKHDGALWFWLSGERHATERELQRALRALADRRATRAAATGATLVIDAKSGATVRDVLRVWDLARAAGFASVRCPRQENWVRVNLPAEPAPRPRDR